MVSKSGVSQPPYIYVCMALTYIYASYTVSPRSPQLEAYSNSFVLVNWIVRHWKWHGANFSSLFVKYDYVKTTDCLHQLKDRHAAL
jgi:hypothetical protein